MKILMYRVGNKSSVKRNSVRINAERILFLSFIITFLLLVTVQAALLNPSIRTFLVSNEEYDGVPLGVEEFLYKQGEIGMELLSEEANSNVKILVNGDETAAFKSKKLNLRVKDGDVVEIDGSGEKNECIVVIKSKSDNIATECVNRGIRVKSNIRKLVEVKMK